MTRGWRLRRRRRLRGWQKSGCRVVRPDGGGGHDSGDDDGSFAPAEVDEEDGMPLQRRDARDLQVPELLRLVLSKVPSTASAEAGLMHKGTIGWLGSSRLEAPAQEPSAQEVAKATATITPKGTEELLRELEAHLAKRIWRPGCRQPPHFGRQNAGAGSDERRCPQGQRD